MAKESLQAYWVISGEEITKSTPDHALVGFPADETSGSVFLFSSQEAAMLFWNTELCQVTGKSLSLYPLHFLIEVFAEDYPTFILDCPDVDNISPESRMPWSDLRTQ